MDLFIPQMPPDEPEGIQPPQENITRIERIRKRRRMRRLRVAAVCVLLVAAVLAYFAGVYGASIAMLGDVVDSISIALLRGNGFPVDYPLSGFITAQELSGGFAALGERDLVMLSASGKELRRIQHGFARPCVTAGNTRVCIYNRGGTEALVESRTRALYHLETQDAILLAEMSDNGTMAVATKTKLSVYDPLLNEIWYWKSAETPAVITFSSDNKHFATATLHGENGALGTVITLFNTQTSEPVTTVTTMEGIPLQMKYLTQDSLLVVFDTFAATYDTTDGTQTAAYPYGMRTLQSASLDAGKNTVLLFASPLHTTLTSVVMLDDTLAEIGAATVGMRANVVSANRMGAYVLTSDSVFTYALDGTFCGETLLEEKPLALVPAGKLLLITPLGAREFTPPPKPAASIAEN
ncbi:MAG: DUF5711 family protein [Ruthenibacterium sp.]